MVLSKISRNIRLFLFADGFYYAGYSLINAFLSILITTVIAPGRVDLIGFVLSYYLGVRVLADIPMSRLTSKLHDDIKIKIIGSGLFAYGVLVLLMGFSTQMFHVFILQTCLALIEALSYPLKWTLFSKIQDKGNEVLEWSLEDIFTTGFTAVTAAIGGVVSVKYGVQSIFMVFSFLFFGAGVCFSLIKIKQPKTR